jgi:hypothetical protein
MVKNQKKVKSGIKRRNFLVSVGAITGGYFVGGCAGLRTQTNTKVAIARANNYEYHLIRKKVEDMFNQIGGIGDVVKPGDLSKSEKCIIDDRISEAVRIRTNENNFLRQLKKQFVEKNIRF